MYRKINSKTRAFITSKMDLCKHAIWIGYNYIDREGNWTLINGEVHDTGNRNKKSIHYWKIGQPDNANGIEDCGHIWFSRFRLTPSLVLTLELNCMEFVKVLRLYVKFVKCWGDKFFSGKSVLYKFYWSNCQRCILHIFLHLYIFYFDTLIF